MGSILLANPSADQRSCTICSVCDWLLGGGGGGWEGSDGCSGGGGAGGGSGWEGDGGGGRDVGFHAAAASAALHSTSCLLFGHC